MLARYCSGLTNTTRHSDMKLKEILTEGTWEAPQTSKQAKELVSLMRNPIPASQAADMLYHLVGDDELFDAIAEAESKDGPESDVRYLVRSKLEDWLKNLDMFRDPWDPRAVKLLQSVV